MAKAERLICFLLYLILFFGAVHDTRCTTHNFGAQAGAQFKLLACGAQLVHT